MVQKQLYVCMTMDVERIIEYSPLPVGGPPTWEHSERSVRAYCTVLAKEGFPATLFVVPDAATQQGAVLREIAEETGAELGMHLHPQCWRDHYQNMDSHDYLGGYTAEGQFQMLNEALTQTTEGLGMPPKAFRGGNFSANDMTFPVLACLGFTHGSVSQPGRAVAPVKAVWKDACPDVHRVHGVFRMVPGDLDFIEIPLTSDRERIDHWTGVGDVRFEEATPQQVAKAVRQEVSRQVEEGALLKHVCFLTHNPVNYWSEDESEGGKRGVLKQSIERIRQIAGELGLAVRGATLGDVRRAFLEAEEGRGAEAEPRFAEKVREIMAEVIDGEPVAPKTGV